uniref:Uncharacterized protein n=1 Tax=Anguilla anguilla TaxID=7936 RepID=A0A0E9RB71_ANGAN
MEARELTMAEKQLISELREHNESLIIAQKLSISSTAAWKVLKIDRTLVDS